MYNHQQTCFVFFFNFLQEFFIFSTELDEKCEAISEKLVHLEDQLQTSVCRVDEGVIHILFDVSVDVYLCKYVCEVFAFQIHIEYQFLRQIKYIKTRRIDCLAEVGVFVVVKFPYSAFALWSDPALIDFSTRQLVLCKVKLGTETLLFYCYSPSVGNAHKSE